MGSERNGPTEAPSPRSGQETSFRAPWMRGELSLTTDDFKPRCVPLPVQWGAQVVWLVALAK